MGELESIAKQDLCIGKAGHFDGVCGSVQEVEDSFLVHSIVGGETNMASKSKRVNSKPDGKTDRYVLKESDYELIVSYLEEPDNFAALFGSGGKTKIGGKHQTKTTAFAVMAVQLQRSGLTDEDIARGITLEAKLNKACPFFYRMDALFGTKSNMVPPATCELGIPRVPAVQILSEDEGSDEEDLTCLEDPKSVSLEEALRFSTVDKPVKNDLVPDSQVQMPSIQDEVPQNAGSEFPSKIIAGSEGCFITGAENCRGARKNGEKKST
ncbi:hypothetical protein R1sor_021516 [Riccia sorocarpa]|uniref:Uncharacterized protein n=1 Tax=Riccia sorocarpa TaxID=122646 RepID=A0ABD3GKF0_9MARC